jgi:2-hydroxychromene-2-carboxylate isomerase
MNDRAINNEANFMADFIDKRVEFFFDLGSPASYLAWTQLPGICQCENASLVFRPMLLGGVFRATGNASPAAIPAKGRYAMIDLMRFAQRYGVPLVPNPYFPVNTLMLMRGATGIQTHAPQRFQDYLRAIFGALWHDALDLNQPAQVASVLAKTGFDPAQVIAWASDAGIKDTLRSTTDEAVSRGVFGAPTIFVGGDMFFGQDRLDFVREALR